MTRHLLSCDCGNDLPVDPGQAGDQVRCSCGRTLDVPPLSQLRRLRVAPREETSSRTRSWGARHATIAAFLTLASLLGGLAAASWITEPDIPRFDSEARQQVVERGMKAMTPADAWWLWIDVYRPLGDAGFHEYQPPNLEALQLKITRRRYLETILLIPAGLCVLGAAIAAMWPSRTAPAPGR